MEDVGDRGNLDAVHANGNAVMKTAVSAPSPIGQVIPAPLVRGFVPIWSVRGFLLLQIATLVSMVSIHFGLLIGGYRHTSAGTAELVIAAVLVAGLLANRVPRPRSRRSTDSLLAICIFRVFLGLVTDAHRIRPT